MSLDELSLGENDGQNSSLEVSSEKSEKQKENSKKAQAQLQKTQKDEKKAKADNDDLFLVLSRFIKNPFYEELIPHIFRLLEKNYPSRFILAIVALTYPDATHLLLHKIGRESQIDLYKELYTSKEKVEFDDATLHESLRKWVTLWMQCGEDFLTKEGTSIVLMQKLSLLLSSKDRALAVIGVSEVFTFFLKMRNISIDTKKSRAYGEFIIHQIEEALMGFLESSDGDLRDTKRLDENQLFGI